MIALNYDLVGVFHLFIQWYLLSASAVLGINAMLNVENKTINAWSHEANILLRFLEEAYHSDHEKQ